MRRQPDDDQIHRLRNALEESRKRLEKTIELRERYLRIISFANAHRDHAEDKVGISGEREHPSASETLPLNGLQFPEQSQD